MTSFPRIISAVLVICILLVIVFYQACTGVLAQEGTTRISCFVMGGVSPAANAFTALFEQDPLFRYRAYPLPTDLPDGIKQKLDRVYYPRTGKELVENYDAMIFRDARVQHFTSRQYRDLDYAFREAGMASVTVHGPSWDHAWSVSTLYDLSPVSEFVIRFYHPWRVLFQRERDPVFLPFADLGMEKVVGDAYGMMKAKHGATVWADMQPQNIPWLVSWRPGGGNAGEQWVFADKFDAKWWGLAYGSRDSNPYAIDLATNLLLYSLDRPLISDIIARREARRLMSTFQAQKLLILSMLEWAEKFGANILHLSERVTEIEAEAQEAVDFYLDQDYPSTISFMESMSLTVCEISDESLRLKDEALFWVYVSEWLAVTSVALVAGVVVWSLMVRRRMYRAVGATRLRIVY